ncbi:hypothetical protein BSIN_0039 [Burkholderia singularis]|uniref:Uncharacterized protein n=1 Tax=Burkholderia singularis TaxID=1503053 RepID=A0A238H224_9BURK|nr:hypothetical protein BSIN_0039 [Burkholderia singularis]
MVKLRAALRIERSHLAGWHRLVSNGCAHRFQLSANDARKRDSGSLRLIRSDRAPARSRMRPAASRRLGWLKALPRVAVAPNVNRYWIHRLRRRIASPSIGESTTAYTTPMVRMAVNIAR